MPPELQEQGFAMVRHAAPAQVVLRLKEEAERLATNEPASIAGIRDLLRKSAVVRDCVHSSWLRALVPPTFMCVRGILFDKAPGANWLVAWHQDVTICVQERRDIAGYESWSMKHGVPHVQPPAGLLEQMITVRIHLDVTQEGNGALRVMAGSHQHGRLSDNEIDRWRSSHEPIVCDAVPGDVLLMKPLLLHASSKAVSPLHRRVVHLEFAPPDALNPSLHWYEG